MSRSLRHVALASSLLAVPALANPPSVAVDIAPLHSLVAQVTHGVAVPNLIIPPGASPHEHNLRPSEAAALQEADLVFWIGPELTPWLQRSIDTLAADASVTALLGAGGSSELEFRESAIFAPHADDEHEHEHGEHAHEEDKHEEQGHDHAHSEHDPHAWLSPQNAVLWLDVLARELSKADPGNADTYAANAAEAQAVLEALIRQTDAALSAVRGRPFVVFHDGYQYFEVSFDIPSAGAIALSDASEPSPARVAEIRELVQERGITCVLAEPQYNPRLVETVVDGTGARTAVIDPLGVDLTLGPELYIKLIGNITSALADCL